MATRKTTAAQVPVHREGNDQCPHHKAEFILACTDCGEELVCAKCTTTTHLRHAFEDISKIAEDRKIKIQEYVTKVENSEIPNITLNLNLTDVKIQKNSRYFKSLEDEIRSRGGKLKLEIDRIMKTLIDNCREIQQYNMDTLSQYTEELQTLYTLLNDRVNTCKQTLQSTDNINIIKTGLDVNQEIKLPNISQCKTANFTVGQLSFTQLQLGYGCLSEGKDIKSNQQPLADVVNGTIVNEFTHGYDVTSIEKSSADSVWVASGENKNISLVKKGRIKQKLKFDNDILDISVSPVTGNLWLSCKDNTVCEVSGKTTPTKRFTTDSLPLSLCLNPDNNVVVGTFNNATVYGPTGQLIHTTPSSGQHLVVYPCHITVCTSTGDIAVCEWDLSSQGGTDKPNVSVFTSKLEIKYQYYGPPQSQADNFTSQFKPLDAVFDSQGFLLIADINNKCIQLVNSDCQFVSIVHTDNVHPWALTLIQDGLLCVGFEDKKIKFIKYKA